jgi:glycogen synthase
MRVLITTDTVGGVWTFTRELISGLLQRNCSVALVSLGALPNQEQREWLEAAKRKWTSSFRFAATSVPLEWMQSNRGAYSQAELLLLRIAEEFDPDLLLSNQFCFGALPIEAPRIVVAHSDVLSWADACRGGVLEHSTWLDRYLRLVRDGLRGADAVVTPTHWMMDALASHFALPPERHVMPNGRTVAAPSTGARKLQAVTAGRVWDEAKNISLLCEIESPPMPLLVAGNQKGETCSAPQAHGGVRYLGEMSEQDLHGLFRESAIYICTSRYEPFGLAPLEAALCGCAVLANDIPSLREVWQEGALYFSDGISLTRLLRHLQSDPKCLAVAQSNSHERALAYSADAMTDGYLALFQQMSCHRPEERNAA